MEAGLQLSPFELLVERLEIMSMPPLGLLRLRLTYACSTPPQILRPGLQPVVVRRDYNPVRMSSPQEFKGMPLLTLLELRGPPSDPLNQSLNQ